MTHRFYAPPADAPDLVCLDLYLVFQYIHGVPDTPITEPAFFVLTVLADGPRHGYGLAGEVAELSHGRVRLKVGSLYGVLDRLAAEGLIEPDREESRDGRLRRYYRLTEDGRRALALGRPPIRRCDCRGAEGPAGRHRVAGAGEIVQDRKARGGMSDNLERRGGRVLRPVPGGYRQQWERDMVAAFPERWLAGGPAADEYGSHAAGPGRAETACVAGLAARVSQGFRVAPPQSTQGLSRPARRRTLALAAAAAVAVLATACSGSSAPSSAGSRPSTPTSSPGLADCLTASRCYAPRQFRVAYGIQPLLDAGIDGRGQTVVLVEYAAATPASPPTVTDIRQDLADFDSRFGLPAARIQVLTAMAGSVSPWLAGMEEVGDTEMVHTVAPDATIRELMVDVPHTSAELAATFSTALRKAASDGDVIVWPHEYGENLFTSAEAATINSALEYAAARHATVVAGSGDGGAIADRRGKSPPVREVSLPASDPLVLSAGGTTLTANRATGAYGSETAWNTPIHGQPAASAGGFSHLFARPAYQDGVPGIGAMRGVPDVAGDASTSGTDMAFAFGAPGGAYALLSEGGTSATGPFWAGLIALADQEAGHPLGFVNPAIYRIARSPQYHKAFHDITTGNNTVVLGGVTITGYKAGPGWNPVTGWGSPNAEVLVPLLARYASPQIGPA
jgi:DNA-binding PadR family transcriptional regulator